MSVAVLLARRTLLEACLCLLHRDLSPQPRRCLDILLHLLSTIDQSLLNRWDSLLLLHMLLDLLNGVGGFDVELDLLACESTDSMNRRISEWYACYEKESAYLICIFAVVCEVVRELREIEVCDVKGFEIM